MSALRFAAIGLNHDHIYGQVNCLLRAGAELVAFHAPEDDLAAAFATRLSRRRGASPIRRAILEDESIGLIVSAAISARARASSPSPRCATART